MAKPLTSPARSTKPPTARSFLSELKANQSPEELKKVQRYFKSGKGEYGEGDEFIGVRMGQVFALAKEFMEMPPDEIERLLESPIHEARAGALSIMAKQAARKNTTKVRKKELFDLCIRRHDPSATDSIAEETVSSTTRSTRWRLRAAAETEIQRRTWPGFGARASLTRKQ